MKRRRRRGRVENTCPDKELARATWRVRTEAWDRWSDVIADLADKLNQPFLDAAGILPGERVLDLASGTGEPALAIARRLGRRGSVVATDLVPDMLATARRRAAVARLDNIMFQPADMEALPFPRNIFARATCRFGIMFCPDVAAAVSEARRVLAASGKATFLVWGAEQNNTIFHVINRVAADIVGEPDWKAELTPFRFAAPGALSAVLEDSGFADVAEQDLRLKPTPPVGSQFWRPPLEMTFGHQLDTFPEATRAELDAALERAYAAYIQGQDYQLNAHVRIVSGHAPP